MKFIALSLLLASFASAARVADVTRVSNQQANEVNGMGLIYGLAGTGDGGDFQPAMKMLAAAMSQFDNAVTVAELRDVKNVAIVGLSAKLPATGVHVGDFIDVRVESMAKSSSLRNGALFSVPMKFMVKGRELVVGMASGKLDIEDPSAPTTGVIKNGLKIEELIPAGDVPMDTFSFYIDKSSASYTMADNIAKMINDGEDGQQWATVRSANEIVVRIPVGEQQAPANFISRLQQLPLPVVPAEARVVVNARSGTIIITGDVEISPVVISHKGLSISTLTPAPVPTPRTPVASERNAVALDTGNTGGAKLQELMNMLDQLKVPVQDRIDILKELEKSGKLHARLMFE